MNILISPEISPGALHAIRIDPAKLRAARQSFGLTLIAAASRLGIRTRQMLHSYESGRCVTPADVLARMCVLYHCQIEDFTVTEK